MVRLLISTFLVVLPGISFAEASDEWPGASYPDMCLRDPSGAITTEPAGGESSCSTYPTERFLKLFKFGLCTQNSHHDQINEHCDFIFDDPNGVEIVGKYRIEVPFPGDFDAQKLSSEKTYTYAVAVFSNEEQGILSLLEFDAPRQSMSGSSGNYCWTTGFTDPDGSNVDCGTLEDANAYREVQPVYLFSSQYDNSPQVVRNWEGWGYNELLDSSFNLAEPTGRFQNVIGDVNFSSWDEVDSSTSTARYWMATRKLTSDIKILESHSVLKIGIGVSEASWLYQTDDVFLNGPDCSNVKCVTKVESAGFDMTAIIR